MAETLNISAIAEAVNYADEYKFEKQDGMP